MIRFIDLGDQILEGSRQFAWWSTIIDQFMIYNYEQSWDTWEEFDHAYREDEKQIDMTNTMYTLERYKGLFPKDWEKMREQTRKAIEDDETKIAEPEETSDPFD
ncbi:MAG: hypothetical protein ACFFCW_22865 [Candidatus Hodarchaeota archaeon]